MSTALIAVDIQNDFCEGGSLAVQGGKVVAQRVCNLVINTGTEYDFVVATKDFHINPGHHFSDTPDFIDSWPRHCVVGTPGAELASPLSNNMFDSVLYKGKWSAAYSGFEAVEQGLAGLRMQLLLAKHGITKVDIVGLALDYCVKATAIDAVAAGLDTTILVDYTASVHPENEEEVLNLLNEMGVKNI